MQVLMECRAIEEHPNQGITIAKLETAPGQNLEVEGASATILLPLGSFLVSHFDDKALDHKHRQYVITIAPKPEG